MKKKVVEACYDLGIIILPITCATMTGIMIVDEIKEIKRSREIKKMAKAWEPVEPVETEETEEAE